MSLVATPWLHRNSARDKWADEHGCWCICVKRFAEAWEIPLKAKEIRVVRVPKGPNADRWEFVGTGVIRVNGRHVFVYYPLSDWVRDNGPMWVRVEWR